MAGIYFLREEVERSERFQTAFLISPIAGGDVSFYQDNETKSYAAFGQLSYALNDAFSVTLGGRWTKDEKTIDQALINNDPNDPVTGIPAGGQPPFRVNGAKDDWSEFTPRLSLDWHVSDDHLLYFTASRGYKSGLFASQAITPSAASTSIDPEIATNLELGAKTQWWDDRLRLNVSVFDLDYEDLQIFQLVDLLLVTSNVDAKINGLEAEFALALTDNFTLSGSYSYLDAEYESETSPDIDGNNLVRSPEDKATLSANYAFNFDSGAIIDFRATWSHVGEFNFDQSADPRAQQDSYDTLDASVKLTPASEVWDMTFWGKNLNDELYIKHTILNATAGAVELYAPPRTFGVTFNYKW